MSTEQPRKKNRKKVVAVVAGLAVVGTAGVAYAYWTAGGSGTGTALSDTTTPLVAHQTVTLTPFYPGDSDQTLMGNFDNNNPGPIYVSTVTASISSVTPVGSGTCDSSDYTLSTPAMTVAAQVPHGTGVGSFSGAKIKFNNKDSAQDGCKGAKVTFTYTIA